MAEAIINIDGIIGGDIFLADIQSQFNDTKKPDSITVFINSDGGRMTEGFAIHDFLIAQGLPITTIGSTVFSIATVILLAGDKGKRFMRPNGRFLVHNPMPSFGIRSDAEGYRDLADMLEKEEQELIAFYASKTSLSPAFLRGEMDKDKPITANEAESMGFISGIQDKDTSKTDNRVPALAAKFIPSENFELLRETLINQNMEQNENQKKLSGLRAGLDWLLNPGGKEVVQPPTPKEVEVIKPDFEARFAAIESQMEAQKAAAIEAGEKSAQEITRLTSLVNQKEEEISTKDAKIKEVIQAIEEMEAEPIVQVQKTPGAIANVKVDNDWSWLITSGRVASFIHNNR